ncbi:hypothetical protein H4219_002603 [Mycoemilia scoparia]|uniref:Uncharacterized protein n=1 Tax=Mycoemilia scoparia TaxID=417184 RepID=A0A9W8DUK1_9FUNG|nr:hypothetical protein H4219_002603 [Mycoemilia scoparia]
MHRVQYAKLMGQHFDPPKTFSVPTIKETKKSHVNSDVYKSEKFTKYLDNLKKMGYFGESIEGSKVYKEKLLAAKNFFDPNKMSEIKEGQKEDSSISAGSGNQSQILATKKIIEILQSPDTTSPEDLIDDTPEDGDEWMFIEPEDLEEILKSAEAKLKQAKIDSDSEKGNEESDTEKISQYIENESATRLGSTLEKFQKFLEEGESGLDGVELDDEWVSSDGDDDGADDYSDSQSGYSDEEVDFDPKGIMNVLKSVVGESQFTNSGLPKKMSEKLPDDKPHINDDSDSEKDNIEELMKRMDAELDKTKVGKSFVKSQPAKYKKTSKLDNDPESTDSDSDREVDIDLNLAQNILSSFKSQQGLPGPAGTLLGQFNYQPPTDHDGEGHGDKR